MIGHYAEERKEAGKLHCTVLWQSPALNAALSQCLNQYYNTTLRASEEVRGPRTSKRLQASKDENSQVTSMRTKYCDSSYLEF